MSDIRSYIDDLFNYITQYENNYAEFQTEAFLQTYNGVYAVFQALRQQRDRAIDVDHYFLEKIKTKPVNSSDLRQLTVQTIVSYFESEADIDGQSNQAYSYCRGLRPIKQDSAFFEHHLTPMLFEEGSLANNFKLNVFFLTEMARFMQRFGSPVQASLPPEEFGRMTTPMKFLHLTRRRLELGNDLLRDRSSLEFHLQQIEAFNKLAQSKRIHNQYLLHWNYLQKKSFWASVSRVLTEFWGKVKGVFSSWRYTRLVLTQRNPAFLFYGLLIVIFIMIAIMVPSWWGSYSDSTLQDLQQRGSGPRPGGGR